MTAIPMRVNPRLYRLHVQTGKSPSQTQPTIVALCTWHAGRAIGAMHIGKVSGTVVRLESASMGDTTVVECAKCR